MTAHYRQDAMVGQSVGRM